MSNGQAFCKLAFDALRREEEDLAKLGRDNPSGRHMSVSGVGEVVTGFLITKEALRNMNGPRVVGEAPYSGVAQKEERYLFFR